MSGDSGQLSFSVIVVSWRRPDWLARCLCGLRQLDHPNFEIIVVADTPSLMANDLTGMKSRACDTPNISVAHNAGILEAAGQYCAFIDDDAVPEPLWLRHHEKALGQNKSDASVGYVRGRNGISFQSRLHSVDDKGSTYVERDQGTGPTIPNLPDSRVLKLIGTNMVIRREALIEIGGFDSAYSYFLDDSDISRRLFQFGYTIVSAPLAEVHHGFASSSRRTSRRAPRDLFEIGRSSAIFERRHRNFCSQKLPNEIRIRERIRLLKHMVLGTLEPRDVKRLMATLKSGWQLGVKENLPEIKKLHAGSRPFLHFKPLPPGHKVLVSRLLGRRSALRKAKELARTNRVSLFSFSLTPVRQHVRYLPPGVWAQIGGQFGPSVRKRPWFEWCKFEPRATKEMSRVAKQRGLEVD